jgi:hypothetical protein
VPGIQVIPPPCSEAASLGQVLSAGSPRRGVDHQVHCRLPVTGSKESRKPGISIASPPTPTITWFFHDQRRRGGEILLTRVGEILPPQLFAGSGVKGDQPIVGGEEIDRGLPDADAALADQMAAMIDPVVMPQFLAGARIERPTNGPEW